MKQTHAVIHLLKSNVHITTKTEQDLFFRLSIWDEFSNRLYNAIKQCVPKNPRYSKSATKKYVTAKDKIIDWVATRQPFANTESEQKRDEATLVIHSLGFEFSKIYHKLITPRDGEKRVPIAEQISKVLKDTESLELKDYFEVGVAKHVYYVVGWLCHAGTKESKRSNFSRCLLTTHLAQRPCLSIVPFVHEMA
jgi:hypothetical protein